MSLSVNILARLPQPGVVKTRLIPELGPVGAARAHEQLVRHVVSVARRWCDTQADHELRLWCTPHDHHTVFHQLTSHHERSIQPTGNLGTRLSAIVEQGLTHHDKVIVLGADAGSLCQDHLQQTAELLDTHKAVILPAEDGGYLMLGLCAFSPDLFNAISWGCSSVTHETIDQLNSLGWSWAQLPAAWDVDRPKDWRRFIQDAP
ncbi:MAG: TIGR04282 family arsenosugar biosynthesis glycosyltransferase [Magnetococcales bacterium]|nr:TIGR04282 family arsenosugar biosynthesis glycosyltransferase [Magnetococcales bacterium]